MLAAVHFVSSEGPVPPLAVINQYLASGHRAETVEFQPTQISEEDYPAIRSELLERGNALHDLEVAPLVQTQPELDDWWTDYLSQFSEAAHDAYDQRSREVMRLEKNDPEITRHLQSKLAFLTEFDK